MIECESNSHAEAALGVIAASLHKTGSSLGRGRQKVMQGDHNPNITTRSGPDKLVEAQAETPNVRIVRQPLVTQLENHPGTMASEPLRSGKLPHARWRLR